MTTTFPTLATEPLHILANSTDDGWQAVVSSGQFKGIIGNGESMEGALDDILFHIYDTHKLVWMKSERVCVKLV